MRFQFARVIRLCFLCLLLTIPLQAQDAPTVTISPEAGEVEQAVFDIAISGLAAESIYMVEILFGGEVVFSSEETSDADGQLAYPISSTAGDAAGIYTLQVLSAGEVVASGEFELTAAEGNETEAQREFLGDVTVTPEVAPFGKVQTIRIGELEAQTKVTVEITASDTLQVAYRRSHTSDDEGVIEIEVFAEEGDTPGLHAIAVYDQDGELIAEGEFTIEAPPQRDASVELRPAAIEAGQSVEIALAGLLAFDSVTAQITSAEGVLIDTILARASSDGEHTMTFATDPDLAEGDYAVYIFVDGEELIGATLTIGEVALAAMDVQLTIDPPMGETGAAHTIAVSGLLADLSFELLILDPAGAEEYRSMREADAEGEFSMTISSTEDDEVGNYQVEIRDDESGDLLAEAMFEIIAADADVDEESDEVPMTSLEPAVVAESSASIEPQAAPIGSNHLIAVSGLQSNEMVEFDVVFKGASVYRSEKRADANGMVTLELVTSEEDEPGDYSITVLRETGNQPSLVLTATAKERVTLVSTIVGDAEVIEGRLVDGGADIEFDGLAGRYALISVVSKDFDPAVALIDGDGFEIAFNDDSRGQKVAVIGPLRLPYSGEYALEITASPLMMPRGAIDGDFVITIAEASVVPINFDTDVAFTLDADAPAHYFALPVETGDSLTVTVDSGGTLDTLLQVVAPSGFEYAFDDDSGAGFDAELSNLVFDHAATYVLVISTFDGGASGQGRVTIRRNPVQALEDGEALVTLNDKAIRDLVVFDAVEDEVLILNLEKLSGDVEDLYVTATVEGMEVMSYSTMGVPDELPLAFVMPMSGRVVVTLEKFGFDDGISLEVSLERP